MKSKIWEPEPGAGAGSRSWEPGAGSWEPEPGASSWEPAPEPAKWEPEPEPDFGRLHIPDMKKGHCMISQGYGFFKS